MVLFDHQLRFVLKIDIVMPILLLPLYMSQIRRLIS
jgi:hypothetical protein